MLFSDIYYEKVFKLELV